MKYKLFINFSILLAAILPLHSAFAQDAQTPHYSDVKAQIFDRHCNDCHGNQNRVYFTDYNLVIRWLSAIQNAVLVTKSMPPVATKLSSDEENLLRRWIAAGAPDDHGQPAPVLKPYPGPLEPNFESISWHIFQVKCTGCHFSGNTQGLPSLSSYEDLMSGDHPLVVPGDPYTSRLYLAADRTGSRAMPPPHSGYAPLTPVELITMKMWIEKGAPRESANQ